MKYFGKKYLLIKILLVLCLKLSLNLFDTDTQYYVIIQNIANLFVLNMTGCALSRTGLVQKMSGLVQKIMVGS